MNDSSVNNNTETGGLVNGLFYSSITLKFDLQTGLYLIFFLPTSSSNLVLPLVLFVEYFFSCSASYSPKFYQSQDLPANMMEQEDFPPGYEILAEVEGRLIA